MSERPFMQLYVSDYLGDTRHLSCEQHGAYLLLLMTMWNAGGELPNDDVKVARIVCLSLKKWRSVKADVLAFFDVSDTVISNNRLTKELTKSEAKSASRASAGAKGGAAKSLNTKEATLANATDLPQHLPDTITREKEEPNGSSKNRAKRLPDDFAPDQSWALAQGLSQSQADNEAAKFLDYWRAKGGINATKLDWAATWRIWVRTAKERLPPPRPGPARPTPITDAVQARISRIRDDEQRRETEGDRDAGRDVPRLVNGSV